MTVNTTGTAPAPSAGSGPQGTISPFDRMMAFLGSEEQGQSQDEATAPEAAEAAEGAETAEESTEDQSAEGAEATEGDEDAESDEQAETEEEQPQDQLYTVRVDGKEEQVPLSELLAGYSRTSDYTRKTQEVAAARKELHTERESLVQERQEYAVLLPKLRQMLEGDTEQEPNWEALRRVDPARAAVEKQRWEEKQEKVRALRDEEDRVSKAQAAEQQAAFKAYVQEQRELLLKRPELAHWSDAEKRKADSADIAAALLEAGFSEEELQIVDHRAMVVAWQAAQYRKLSKAKQAATQSVKQKIQRSPTVKAGAPAGKPKTAADRARSSLAKTGRKTDAEAWFLATLD